MSASDDPTPVSVAWEFDGLIASLDRAIADMSRLAELMLGELKALESRDLDGLLDVVRDKQRLVARLEAETAQQQRWVEGAGFDFKPLGIEQFIQAHDQSGQLGTRWSILLEHTRRCDQLNRDNARSIERDWRRVTTMLRLLKGEDASTTTYDPRGRAASGGQRGRTISQA